jgi:hypothetical protein
VTNTGSGTSTALEGSEISTIPVFFPAAFAAAASAFCRLNASSFCFPANLCSSLDFLGGIAPTAAAWPNGTATNVSKTEMENYSAASD